MICITPSYGVRRPRVRVACNASRIPPADEEGVSLTDSHFAGMAAIPGGEHRAAPALRELNSVVTFPRYRKKNLKCRCTGAITKVVERAIVGNRLEEDFSVEHPHCFIINGGKVGQRDGTARFQFREWRELQHVVDVGPHPPALPPHRTSQR